MFGRHFGVHLSPIDMYGQEYIIKREGVSYSSVVPCTAVVRVLARLMIFTMCGVINGVIVGSRIRIGVVTQRALAELCKLNVPHVVNIINLV